MTVEVPRPVLKGSRALVVGIANEHSIAYGCAKAFRELGADLAITYLNEKARPHVEPLAHSLDAPLFLPLDVSVDGQLEAVFEAVDKKWGRLDILVHSIAFAPKEDLQGGLINCAAAGFAKAMDVSCHSFVRMARLAAPLMKNGGTMMAMSYHGAAKVVPTYSVMGPVKAALESCCRYLAYELGGQGIRVHAISPGPLKTRAAGGLKDFDLLLTEAAQRAPIGELVDIMDVGFTCAYLAAPLMTHGGTMFAMSYYGANKVIPTYSVMGPVKAALESCCRYLAYELGGKGIRVHAISPGPLKTRAATGLKDFDLLLTEVEQRAPVGELVDILDVGFTCAFLATPYARRLSGETLYVDGGVNIMA